jgi:hypothetical protein
VSKFKNLSHETVPLNSILYKIVLTGSVRKSVKVGLLIISLFYSSFDISYSRTGPVRASLRQGPADEGWLPRDRIQVDFTTVYQAQSNDRYRKTTELVQRFCLQGEPMSAQKRCLT